MEIKPNRISFYAETQLVRGRFWLQLWTLKKFSEPHVSRKYLAKMWNVEKFINGLAICSDINGRGLLGKADGAVLHVSIYSLVYNCRRRRQRRACLRDFKHIAYISRNS